MYSEVVRYGHDIIIISVKEWLERLFLGSIYIYIYISASSYSLTAWSLYTFETRHDIKGEHDYLLKMSCSLFLVVYFSISS